MYTKKKYEQIAQEEIDSVKEVLTEQLKKLKNDISEQPPNAQHVNEKLSEMAKNKPNLTEYAAKVHENGYTNYSDVTKQETSDKEDETVEKAYVISPDEFGEFEDYEKISLTYYADQVLADNNDDLVDDIENVVGFDSFNHFGEYEEDSVFVRNDWLKCDYEILADPRNYHDVKKKKPREVEI